MNARDIDQEEIERHLVREVQNQHARAHQALLNWAKWSRDRRGIFPSPNPPPSSIYDAIRRDEWDRDGYGDPAEVNVSEERLAQNDIKAERQEVEPYDEMAGNALDERLHGPMFPEYLRQVAKAAYLSPPTVSEHRFYLEWGRISGQTSTPERFREYLKHLLNMAERFA